MMDSVLMRLSRFHRRGPAKVLVGLLVFCLLSTAYFPMAIGQGEAEAVQVEMVQVDVASADATLTDMVPVDTASAEAASTEATPAGAALIDVAPAEGTPAEADIFSESETADNLDAYFRFGGDGDQFIVNNYEGEDWPEVIDPPIVEPRDDDLRITYAAFYPGGGEYTVYQSKNDPVTLHDAGQANRYGIWWEKHYPLYCWTLVSNWPDKYEDYMLGETYIFEFPDVELPPGEYFELVFHAKWSIIDPEIVLEKSATINDVPYVEGMTAQIGDIINYTITLTSVGAIPFIDILVTDPLLQLEQAIEILDVGESISLAGSLEVSPEHGLCIKNIATAYADNLGLEYQSNEVIIPVATAVDYLTVSYNIGAGNTGTVPIDPTQYQPGDLALVLAGSGLATDNGELFAGWQIGGEGPVYYPGSWLRVVGDTELVARYLPLGAPEWNTLNVSYVSNYPGGETVTFYQGYSAPVITLNEEVLVVYGLDRAGYDFLHWTMVPTPTFGTTIFHPGSAYNFYFFSPTPQLKQLTFYAQWQKAEPVLLVEQTAFINGVLYYEDMVATVGDTITYIVTVTNKGSAAFTDILVQDPLLNLEQRITRLNPGASTSFEGALTVLNTHGLLIENEATASVDGYEFSDTLAIPVQELIDVSLTKIATINGVSYSESTLHAKAGDVVNYTITLSNLGNVALQGVVEDPMFDFSVEITLPVGACWTTHLWPYLVSDDDSPYLHNTATAFGLTAEVVIPVEKTIKYFGVTYNVGLGTSGNVPEDNNLYLAGDLARVLDGSDLTIDNYELFAGWQINGAGPVYYPGSVVTVNGDIELVACYLPPKDPGFNVIHITYVGNYPGGGAFTTVQPPSSAVTFPSVATATANGLERPGYDLLHWTAQPIPAFGSPAFMPGGTYHFFFTTAYPMLKQVTFYAQWAEAEPKPEPVKELTVYFGAFINDDRYEEGMQASLGDTIHYTVIVVNTGEVGLADIRIVEPSVNLDESVACMPIFDYAIYEFREEVLSVHGLLIRREVTAYVDDLAFSNLLEIPVLADGAVGFTKRATINGTPYEEGMTALPGDVVFYTVDLVNNGNVDLNGVVDDPMVGFSEDINLLAGEKLSVDVGHYTVTTADDTTLHNIAYAFGVTAELIIPIEQEVIVGYYDVTYNANGGYSGYGGYTDLEYPSDHPYVVRNFGTTGITNPEHRLTSWNTAAEGTGATYMPGDTLYLTGNLELFAQWTPIAEGEYYTITFLPGEGGGYTPSYTGPRPVVIYLAPGEVYTFSDAYSVGIDRRWWNFDGWLILIDNTYYRFKADREITVTQDLEFFATWFTEG